MSLVVNAGPGTGKSYSGTKLCTYLKAQNKHNFLDKTNHTEEQRAIWEWVAKNMDIPPQPKILYAAYNADFVPEIKPMVPSTGSHAPKVSTIHGAGYAVLNSKYGYLRINAQRGIQIVETITGQNFFKLKDSFKWLSSLRYVEKIKDELLEITPENLELLRLKYDSLANMPIHNETVNQCKQLIVAMKTIDRKAGIDYIDQVWLPLFLLKSPIYDLGIIDECQDLSASRLMLVKKLCRELVFVGDPDQAINAFAGADPRAFERVQDICKEELPLKTSFRNPPNVVLKANNLMRQRIVPDTKKRTWLKAHKTENGPEKSYTINEIGLNLPDSLESNLILCRYNAPLITCALKLIKADIPAFIYGKSLVKELLGIIKGRKARTIDELLHKLEDYEERSCANVKEHIQEIIRDKLDCIRTIAGLCGTIDEIEPTMKDLIQEDKKNSVNLCTIHKAKGRERRNVHILFPPIESSFATTPDQLQQEQNLHYVALTRTSHSLSHIHRE